MGIGLPAMIPGIPGPRLAEWAQAAEAAGFASLSCTDRLVYETFDPFAIMAVAASVTREITLRTAVLLGPLRPSVQFAAAGCDELILIPCAGGIEQVELLARAIPGGLPEEAGGSR